MPNTALRFEEPSLPPRLRAPELVEENGLERALSGDSHGSPARALQQRLLREYLSPVAHAQTEVRRFPVITRLTIIFGATALIWAPLFGLAHTITAALNS